MRLQLNTSTPGPSDSVREVGSAAAEATDSRVAYSPAASGDSIGISSTTKVLSQAAGERSARLQYLTEAVRSGSYRVTGDAISGALLAQASV